MQKGDKIKIEGRLGFLMNPTMVVLEVKNSMVLIQSADAKDDGILSCLNASWHGIDTLKDKIDLSPPTP